MSKEKKDYEVGFKKPPASGKFKKGASGNPKGRPKGSKNFTTLFDHEMNEVINITENGEHKRVSRKHASAKRYANQAVMGDPKMLPVLLKLDEANERGHAQSSHSPILDSKDAMVMSSIIQRICSMQRSEQPTNTSDTPTESCDATISSTPNTLNNPEEK